MAIELNARTKILAGVVVLAAAGAGAWFFFLDEFLNPPPPAKVAATAPAKPAADAAKPAAEGPKSAAAKPAAARPIPTDPDKLIAEIIEISGVKAEFQGFARGIGRFAAAVVKPADQKLSDAEARVAIEIAGRIFDADAMTAEVAASLKANLNAERMTRLVEIRRQPIVLKMVALETRPTSMEETYRLQEDFRKNPPSVARQKLVQTLDELQQSSEVGVQIMTLTAREIIDGLVTGLQKAGKRVPKEGRQAAGSRIVAAQGSMRAAHRNGILLAYRDASDEELAEYVKLIDTDTGRWGLQLLAGAVHSAIESRVRNFAKEVAQVAVHQALAKGPAAQPLVPAEEEKPAEKLATAAPPPAPAAEPPAYKRPANIRELYTRYNDLITATVMRDRAAVKELLDDGKYPNVRQKDGTTPLMIAASNGDTELAAMLLAKGADPNLRAPGGGNALALAKERGNAELVRLLVSKGAKD